MWFISVSAAHTTVILLTNEGLALASFSPLRFASAWFERQQRSIDSTRQHGQGVLAFWEGSRVSSAPRLSHAMLFDLQAKEPSLARCILLQTQS